MLGEGHLRLIDNEHVEHCHHEKNHQGLDNQLLERPPQPADSEAPLRRRRRRRIGGLLNFYYQKAA